MKYGACNIKIITCMSKSRNTQEISVLLSQRFEKFMDLRNAMEFDEYNPCQLGMYNII